MVSKTGKKIAAMLLSLAKHLLNNNQSQIQRIKELLNTLIIPAIVAYIRNFIAPTLRLFDPRTYAYVIKILNNASMLFRYSPFRTTWALIKIFSDCQIAKIFTTYQLLKFSYTSITKMFQKKEEPKKRVKKNKPKQSKHVTKRIAVFIRGPKPELYQKKKQRANLRVTTLSNNYRSRVSPDTPISVNFVKVSLRALKYFVVSSFHISRHFGFKIFQIIFNMINWIKKKVRHLKSKMRMIMLSMSRNTISINTASTQTFTSQLECTTQTILLQNEFGVNTTPDTNDQNHGTTNITYDQMTEVTFCEESQYESFVAKDEESVIGLKDDILEVDPQPEPMVIVNQEIIVPVLENIEVITDPIPEEVAAQSQKDVSLDVNFDECAPEPAADFKSYKITFDMERLSMCKGSNKKPMLSPMVTLQFCSFTKRVGDKTTTTSEPKLVIITCNELDLNPEMGSTIMARLRDAYGLTVEKWTWGVWDASMEAKYVKRLGWNIELTDYQEYKESIANPLVLERMAYKDWIKMRLNSWADDIRCYNQDVTMNSADFTEWLYGNGYNLYYNIQDVLWLCFNELEDCHRNFKSVYSWLKFLVTKTYDGYFINYSKFSWWHVNGDSLDYVKNKNYFKISDAAIDLSYYDKNSPKKWVGLHRICLNNTIYFDDPNPNTYVDHFFDCLNYSDVRDVTENMSFDNMLLAYRKKLFTIGNLYRVIYEKKEIIYYCTSRYLNGEYRILLSPMVDGPCVAFSVLLDNIFRNKPLDEIKLIDPQGVSTGIFSSIQKAHPRISIIDRSEVSGHAAICLNRCMMKCSEKLPPMRITGISWDTTSHIFVVDPPEFTATQATYLRELGVVSDSVIKTSYSQVSVCHNGHTVERFLSDLVECYNLNQVVTNLRAGFDEIHWIDVGSKYKKLRKLLYAMMKDASFSPSIMTAKLVVHSLRPLMSELDKEYVRVNPPSDVQVVSSAINAFIIEHYIIHETLDEYSDVELPERSDSIMKMVTLHDCHYYFEEISFQDAIIYISGMQYPLINNLKMTAPDSILKYHLMPIEEDLSSHSYLRRLFNWFMSFITKKHDNPLSQIYVEYSPGGQGSYLHPYSIVPSSLKYCRTISHAGLIFFAGVSYDPVPLYTAYTNHKIDQNEEKNIYRVYLSKGQEEDLHPMKDLLRPDVLRYPVINSNTQRLEAMTELKNPKIIIGTSYQVCDPRVITPRDLTGNHALVGSAYLCGQDFYINFINYHKTSCIKERTDVLQTGPSIYCNNNELHQYEYCGIESNIHEAVFARQMCTKVVPDPKYLNSQIEWVRKFLNILTDRMMEDTTPLDPLESWLSSRAWNCNKKDKYRKNINKVFSNEKLNDTLFDNYFTCMVKTGETYPILGDLNPHYLENDDKAARNISNPIGECLLGLPTYYQSSEIADVRRCLPNFCHGKNFVDLGKVLTDIYCKGYEILCADSSRHDAHQHYLNMEMIDVQFYKMLEEKGYYRKLTADDSYYPRVKQVMDLVRTNLRWDVKYNTMMPGLNGRSKLTKLFRLTLKGTVLSGHPTQTTLGNTLRVIIYTATTLGISPEELFLPINEQATPFLVSGDDQIIFTRTPDEHKELILNNSSRNKESCSIGWGQCIKEVLTCNWNQIDFLSKMTMVDRKSNEVKVFRSLPKCIFGSRYWEPLAFFRNSNAKTAVSYHQKAVITGMYYEIPVTMWRWLTVDRTHLFDPDWFKANYLQNDWRFKLSFGSAQDVDMETLTYALGERYGMTPLEIEELANLSNNWTISQPLWNKLAFAKIRGTKYKLMEPKIKSEALRKKMSKHSITKPQLLNWIKQSATDKVHPKLGLTKRVLNKMLNKVVVTDGITDYGTFDVDEANAARDAKNPKKAKELNIGARKHNRKVTKSEMDSAVNYDEQALKLFQTARQFPGFPAPFVKSDVVYPAATDTYSVAFDRATTTSNGTLFNADYVVVVFCPVVSAFSFTDGTNYGLRRSGLGIYQSGTATSTFLSENYLSAYTMTVVEAYGTDFQGVGSRGFIWAGDLTLRVNAPAATQAGTIYLGSFPMHSLHGGISLSASNLIKAATTTIPANQSFSLVSSIVDTSIVDYDGDDNMTWDRTETLIKSEYVSYAVIEKPAVSISDGTNVTYALRGEINCNTIWWPKFNDLHSINIARNYSDFTNDRIFKSDIAGVTSTIASSLSPAIKAARDRIMASDSPTGNKIRKLWELIKKWGPTALSVGKVIGGALLLDPKPIKTDDDRTLEMLSADANGTIPGLVVLQSYKLVKPDKETSNMLAAIDAYNAAAINARQCLNIFNNRTLPGDGEDDFVRIPRR
jgi:nucleoid DNA-binding protein